MRSSNPGSRYGAAITVSALAVSICLPNVARAQDELPFDIWNLSSADVMLDHYDPVGGHQFRPSVNPRPGDVMQPGKNFHLVIIRQSVQETVGFVANLVGRGASAAGQTQNWLVSMGTHDQIYCTVGGNKPPAHQTAACGSYIGKGGNVATIADEPGYKVTIPASDTAKQDQINQDLCHNTYKTQLNIKCTDSADALTVYAGWTTWTLPHKK